MQLRMFVSSGAAAGLSTTVFVAVAAVTLSGVSSARANGSGPSDGNTPETPLIGKHGGTGIPQQLYAPGGTIRQADPFGMTLEAWAALPLGFGGGLSIEGPFGFRAGIGAGVMPSAFIDLALTAIKSPGAWDSSAEAEIVSRMEDPLFMRLTFALAPPTLGGFYVAVGYGFMRAGVQVTAGDIDRSLWPPIEGVNDETTAALTVVSHHVTADIGWEFDLGGHWRLRTTLGGIFTFTSTADLQVTDLAKTVTEEDRRAGIATAEQTIESAVTSYGSIPSLTISIGYRIF